MRYRRKPILVEAMFHDGTVSMLKELTEWLLSDFAPVMIEWKAGNGLEVVTVLRVEPGDWLVREAGRWVVVSDAKFKELYDEVAD